MFLIRRVIQRKPLCDILCLWLLDINLADVTINASTKRQASFAESMQNWLRCQPTKADKIYNIRKVVSILNFTTSYDQFKQWHRPVLNQ